MSENENESLELSVSAAAESAPQKRVSRPLRNTVAVEVIRIILCLIIIIAAIVLKQTDSEVIASAVSENINGGMNIHDVLSDIGKNIADGEAWARLFGLAGGELSEEVANAADSAP